MTRLSLLIFLSAAALCAQDISVDGGPAWGDFSILFTPKIEPAGAAAAQLNSAVIDAAVTGATHRFIYDEKNKRAFGYDVLLEPSADGSTAQLRIEPLSDPQWAIRNGWAMWGAAPSGLPRYPVIPNLKLGDKIALDLLVNPATGQKIVDYLTLLQAHAPPGPPHDFSLSDVLMKLDAPDVYINGKPLPNPGKPLGAVSGRAIALYVEGYGRLIFSLFPQPTLGFRKNGVIAGNALTFQVGATEFRVVGKSRVAPGDARYNLYLFSDPDWRPTRQRARLQQLRQEAPNLSSGVTDMRGLVFFLIGVLVFAAEPASFEAVSIKPHPEPVYVSRSSTSGTYASWEAGTLRDLIAEAWNLKYYQVPDQPSWLSSAHFDISARAPGNTEPSKDALRQMLQTMLADRFHLRVHFESKEIPVYALVVANSGHKLKEPDMTSREGYTMAGSGKVEIIASHDTILRLADQLSNSAGRPVIDRTGLAGMFAFKLQFNPSTTTESDLPSLPTALRDQLGLRLEPQNAPLETIVIDFAGRPTPN